MRWSKLKSIIEDRIAKTLSGRFRFESTRYRFAHDQEGRWGLVIDGREVWGMGCILADREEYWRAKDLQQELDIPFREGWNRSVEESRSKGRHNQDQFYEALFEFTQMDVSDALNSEDALIRSLAYLDSRVGKRRLHRLALVEPRTELESICLGERLRAEGITPMY